MISGMNPFSFLAIPFFIFAGEIMMYGGIADKIVDFAKSLAIVKAGGAEIVDVDKASFQAAMKPVYDKFLKDPKLQDMVKRINAVK